MGLECEPAVAAARAAYDGLSDAAKGYVSNYQVLLDSENALNIIRMQQQQAAEQAAAQQAAQQQAAEQQAAQQQAAQQQPEEQQPGL